MSGLHTQILAASRISLKSMALRIGPSLTTILTTALVVAVLLSFQTMSNGFNRAVTEGGSDSVALILSQGASKEINSSVTRDQASLLNSAPGIAHVGGEPILSPEFYVVVNSSGAGDKPQSSLQLRGMNTMGPGLRSGFRLVSGRMFQPGKGEIMVGKALRETFPNLRDGKVVSFGHSRWRVVGTFVTASAAYESEMWTDGDTLRSLFERQSGLQSVRVKLISPQAIETLRRYVNSDPRLKLSVYSETDYLRDSASRTGDVIMYLGWPLAIAMSLGALAGAMNTTYNSVRSRSSEIATLRALGFRGVAAFFGVLSESIVLSVVGGILASILVYLATNGITASTIGNGFTQQIFSFSLTPTAVMEGLVLALVVGFLGGVAPAIRAARMPIAAAFHE